MSRVSLALLIAGLLAACGQQDVEPVKISHCSPGRGSAGWRGLGALDDPRAYRVTETNEQCIRRDDMVWCMDCSNGHLAEHRPSLE